MEDGNKIKRIKKQARKGGIIDEKMVASLFKHINFIYNGWL
jgi:hypothetical protein